MDSPNYNDSNQFCPVILKVDEKLLLTTPKNEHDQNDFSAVVEQPYLLQVWDREGRMIFERKLDDRPRHCGIYGDVFLFVEQEALDTV